MLIKDLAKMAMLSATLYSSSPVNARRDNTVLVEILQEDGKYQEHMKGWTPETDSFL